MKEKSAQDQREQRQIDFVHKRTGWSTERIETLQLMSRKYQSSDLALSEDEQGAIERLLSDVIGNMQFNRDLDRMERTNQADTGISSAVLKGVTQLSYRTRHAKDFAAIEGNLIKLENAIHGDALSEKERLSLQDYGALYDLSSLNKDAGHFFNRLISQESNSTVSRLAKLCHRAELCVSVLDKTFRDEFSTSPGIFMLDNFVKLHEISGDPMGWMSWTATTYTPYLHAAKAYEGQNKYGLAEHKVSHVNPEYRREELQLRRYLYSDIYRLKVENLINDEVKDLLKQTFGDDWLVIVEGMLSEIERDIHDSARMNQFEANTSVSAYLQIGISIATGNPGNVHTNTKEIRDQILGKGRWNKEAQQTTHSMLCSEFVGKTMIASVHELNDRLKQKLEEQGVNEHDLPETLVQNPLKEDEILHVLTPDRLLASMQERGSVEVLPECDKINRVVAVTKMKESLAEIKADHAEGKEEQSSKSGKGFNQ